MQVWYLASGTERVEGLKDIAAVLVKYQDKDCISHSHFNSMTRIDRWCNKVTNCIVVFGLLCLIVGACNSSKRATRLAYKSIRVDKPAAAKVYADVFPPLDSVRTNTEYLKGEDILQWDTLYITQEIVGDTVYKTQYRDRLTKRVDTVRTKQYFYIINRGIETQLKDANITIAKQDQQINVFWWIIGILGGYTVLRIAARIWFPTLAKFFI